MPARVQKKSNAIWWILGGIAAVLVIGVGLVVMLIAVASLNSGPNNNLNANTRIDNRNSNVTVNANVANVNANTTNSTPANLTDDFSEQKWGVGSSQFGRIWYEGGEYHMISKEASFVVIYAPDTDDYSTENATVKVTARSVDGGVPSAGFGLMAHCLQTKARQLEDYALLIYPSDEPEYEVIMHKDGKQSTLVPKTKSSAIHSGSAANLLEIRIKGAQLAFYANGQYLTTVTDSENFKHGRAGLYTSDVHEVVFDNLVNRALAPNAGQSESHSRPLQRPHLFVHATRQFSDRSQPGRALYLPDDRFFSRNHCLLEMNPPHSYLRDLGSTNGTFLNGQRVKDASLKNGDQIQCGETILLVEVTANVSNDLSETTQDALTSRPVLVMVECLNCGRREQAQASAPDEHLTFLCEDCRIELKRSPQAIPGYDTVKLLGRGGMGSVMLAREQRTGRAVAIKTLLPEFAVSDKAMRRFMREIDVAAALKHKHIVEFIDRGTHNGVVYLVSEFVDGADASKLAEDRRRPAFLRRGHCDHLASARCALVCTRARLHSSRLQRSKHSRVRSFAKPGR